MYFFECFSSATIPWALTTRDTSAWYLRVQYPLCVWEEAQQHLYCADAEPVLVVTGSRAYDVERSGRFIAADAGGHVIDGVASERPATANTFVSPM